MDNRYNTRTASKSQPGSRSRVLRNKLGITDRAEMDETELLLLERLYKSLLLDHLPDRVLTVADLKTWHRLWLGNIYAWAGEERSVNMSKAGFHFAAAAQIPRLLSIFERGCLAPFTPCHRLAAAKLEEALAMTHVELILIHPFREGNGRLARLLADVMTAQAGYGPLDYSAWDADKPAYLRAIQAGLSDDYSPMTRLVELALN
jgi:cell filamentation protein